jgi:alpha-mannosidase
VKKKSTIDQKSEFIPAVYELFSLWSVVSSGDAKITEIYLNRVKAFKAEHQLGGKLYSQRAPLTSITAWRAPGVERTPIATALQHVAQFAPIRVGEHQFEPPWSTHFVQVVCDVPPAWAGREVHLLWDANAEETVYDGDGRVLQGMNGSTGEDRRAEFVVTYAHEPARQSRFTFYIGVACNGLFGNSEWGVGPTPPNPHKKCPLKQAELGCFDREAWDLFYDFAVVADMAEHLPKDSARGRTALRTANAIVNACNVDDRATWPAARAVARTFLSQTTGAGAHTLWAVGHAHIDTAWLWPYAETRRKVARSWSTQLRLGEEFPDYRFVASQAVQFEWLKADHPELFARLQAAAKTGSFVPIGGTYVEMDCNIPSGESLARQFLVGQRFFEREFGVRSRTFFLPDTFGYASQLPQIMRLCGIDYFLTQKLSWNQINKMPHNTFTWRGIDGSAVITHFPPADTYNSHATAADLIKSEVQSRDNDHSNHSLLVFGHGDGGGGPQRRMLEYLTRARDVDGLPRVQLGRTPTAFFDQVARDAQERPLDEWCGELYFEYHRGTYTSQALVKRYNRLSEALLHDVEFLFVAGRAVGGAAGSPTAAERAECDRLWRIALLNQFHDVIPGTSIHEVYVDVHRLYEELVASAATLTGAAIARIAKAKLADAGKRLFVCNTLAFERNVVVALSAAQLDGVTNERFVQRAADGTAIGVVSLPACGIVCNAASELLATPPSAGQPTAKEFGDDLVVLSNGALQASFSRSSGRLLSLLLGDRECIEAKSGAEGANRFVLHDDVPLAWDAWDVDVFHLEKFTTVNKVESYKLLVGAGPVRASIEFVFRLSDKSTLTQTIHMFCAAVQPSLVFECSVDWHERRKFLKVEFPLAIMCERFTSEVPFGVAQRPTHWNTSWEHAKFEVCAQRFVDLSEHNFGVLLLNDCKYGYACRGNLLTMSLLRAPVNPDETCDIGKHQFKWALVPHTGTLGQSNASRLGHSFNSPAVVRAVADDAPTQRHSLVWVEPHGCKISAVKPAEDDPNDTVVLHMFEPYGGRGSFTVHWAPELAVERVLACNLLEDDLGELEHKDRHFKATFKPFQIRAFKLKLKKA